MLKLDNIDNGKSFDWGKASEELILKINPDWKGAHYEAMKVDPDRFAGFGFEMEKEYSYTEDIPFTRDSWAGRIRATRGVGAVLEGDELKDFNDRHLALLGEVASEKFEIPHHVLINSFKRRGDKCK